MVALDVVYKRLNTIGLGDFCLELHSNKARKKDVLSQLDRALNIGRIKPPSSYSEEADAIQLLRKELNEVVCELHKQRAFGLSLYEAIALAEEYSDYPSSISFTREQVATLTSQDYSRWKELCEMVAAIDLSCGGVRNHPLREYKQASYTQSVRSDLSNSLSKYRSELLNLKGFLPQVKATVDVGDINTYGKLKALNNLCALLVDMQRIPPSVLLCQDLAAYQRKISDVGAAGRTRDSSREQLLVSYSRKILEFDAESALLQWNHAVSSWFLPKALGMLRVSKEVKFFATDKKLFNKEETPELLKLICEYQKADADVRESASFMTSLFGLLFDDGKGDWSLLDRVTESAVQLREAIKSTTESETIAGKLMQDLSKHLDQNAESFIKENQATWRNYSEVFRSLEAQETALSEQFNNPFEQWHQESNWIALMLEKSLRWQESIDGLRDYCGYLHIKAQLDTEGLQTVTDSLEQGVVDATNVVGAFVQSLSKACVNHIIDTTPSLNTFRGNLFSQKIERLKELNEQYQALTKQELAARLSAKIPVLSAGVSGSSEIGILQRAIKSGGRMMSVRKLFESIPSLLRKLCPCMLMSPISVAQYLSPNYPPFDVVVFDEASQLPTSEAIGAIARGSELIVVGDPKQLPPTSFFTAQTVDDDNCEKEDLESILDDCLALSMPQEHLLWHYRSRHESLIAFSNRKYYENKLYTFPSPNDMISQVRLVPVGGYYDRGRTKQNRAEAGAIIAEIIRRLSDPILSKRSIGVVTFSSVQQNLIEDMLEEELRKRPDLDEIANCPEEPLFVKNLENVQGDERDVILFSVGYGPNKEGKVSLNFGPLNREGGWRRLNVAVSRAKHEMIIFSALRPEQIDLNRTRAEGVAGLKAFLEFAERGTSALPYFAGAEMASQSLIESIAEAIRGLGYSVKRSIGCSGYQVDIGVVHPDNPDTYILGILCDSENYRSGGTALDRNCTQEAVLRGLGWQISRIWVLDWWDNPKKELERIAANIDCALKESVSTKELESTKVSATQQPDFERIEPDTLSDAIPSYQITDLPMVEARMRNPEYFCGYVSTEIIKEQIRATVSGEAPICSDALRRRVLDAWGITRAGARINSRFDAIVSSMGLRSTVEPDRVFYWRADEDPAKYEGFRVPSSDQKTRRNLEQIPPEEIASSIKYILDQQIGLSKEDLKREVSRIFGFSRCTEAMQKCIRVGLTLAIARGWAVEDGDRINLPS